MNIGYPKIIEGETAMEKVSSVLKSDILGIPSRWYFFIYKGTNAIVQGINEISCQNLILFLLYVPYGKVQSARTIEKSFLLMIFSF